MNAIGLIAGRPKRVVFANGNYFDDAAKFDAIQRYHVYVSRSKA